MSTDRSNVYPNGPTQPPSAGQHYAWMGEREAEIESNKTDAAAETAALAQTVGQNQTAAETALGVVDTKVNQNKTDGDMALALLSGTVGQNKTDAETALGVVDTKVDQNKTDGDTALALLSGTVGQNRTDAETALGVVDAKVDQNKTDGAAALSGLATVIGEELDLAEAATLALNKDLTLRPRSARTVLVFGVFPHTTGRSNNSMKSWVSRDGARFGDIGDPGFKGVMTNGLAAGAIGIKNNRLRSGTDRFGNPVQVGPGGQLVSVLRDGIPHIDVKYPDGLQYPITVGGIACTEAQITNQATGEIVCKRDGVDRRQTFAVAPPILKRTGFGDLGVLAGQSWATAVADLGWRGRRLFNTYPVLPATAHMMAPMTLPETQGPRPWGEAQIASNSQADLEASRLTRLVPLREQAALAGSVDSNNQFESSCTAAATTLLLDYPDVTSDLTMAIVAFGVTPIEALTDADDPNNPGTKNAAWTGLQRVFDQHIVNCFRRGLTPRLLFYDWEHGQANASDTAAEYRVKAEAHFIAVKALWASRLSVFGNDVPALADSPLIIGVAENFLNSSPSIMQPSQAINAMIADGTIHGIAGPYWAFPGYSGSTHRAPEMNIEVGAMIGHAVGQAWRDRTWKPCRPVSAVVTGDQVDVTFQISGGAPLVFDDQHHVVAPGGGFRIEDDGGQTLASGDPEVVSLAGSRIDLAATPIGNNARLRLGMDSFSGNANLHPKASAPTNTNGPRTNFRGGLLGYNRFTGRPIYDWALQTEITL